MINLRAAGAGSAMGAQILLFFIFYFSLFFNKSILKQQYTENAGQEKSATKTEVLEFLKSQHFLLSQPWGGLEELRKLVNLT